MRKFLKRGIPVFLAVAILTSMAAPVHAKDIRSLPHSIPSVIRNGMVPSVTDDCLVFEINSQEDWDQLYDTVYTAEYNPGTAGYICNMMFGVKTILFDDVMPKDAVINVNCDLTLSEPLGFMNSNTGNTVTIDLHGHTVRGSSLYLGLDGRSDIILTNGTLFDDSVQLFPFSNIGTCPNGVWIKDVVFDVMTKPAIYSVTAGTQLSLENVIINGTDTTKTTAGCTAVNASYGNLTMDHVEIHDYHHALNYQNGSLPTSTINDLQITGATVGILSTNNPHVKFTDIDVRGIGGTESVGIIGVGNGTTLNGFLADPDHYFLRNSQIRDCYIGMDLSAESGVIVNVDITDVNSACTTGAVSAGPVIAERDFTRFVDETSKTVSYAGYSSGSAAFILINSRLYAKDQVDSHSVGVCGGNIGPILIGSEVAGFQLGATNAASELKAINSLFSNRYCNLNCYIGLVYGCELKNATYNYIAREAESYVYDSTITSDRQQSIGFLNAGRSTTHIVGTNGDAALIDEFNSRAGSTGILEYCTSNNIIKKSAVSLIENYENGILDWDGNQIQLSNTEIRHFTNGITMDNSSLYMLAGNKIHDGVCGIQTYRAFIESGNDKIEVYDCSDYGWKSVGRITTAGSGGILFIHDNGYGMMIEGGATLALDDRSEICSNAKDGVLLLQDASHSDFKVFGGTIYGNGEYNLHIIGDVNLDQIQTGGNVLRLSNGGLGNLRIENPSGALYIRSDETDVDPTILSLAGDTYLDFCQSAFSGNDDDLYFELDDDKYVAGHKVAIINDSAPFYTDSMYLRTHTGTVKEGWAIKVQADASTVYPELLLAQGCKVIYDYETNGGSSWNSGYSNVISYYDGEDIDLSYTANRPGWEFVGWNTDKDATEGIRSLKAATSDITLYAIYRKVVTVTYHTFEDSLDYRQRGYIFNLSPDIYSDQGSRLSCAEYSDYMQSNDDYRFIGYSDQEHVVDNIYQSKLLSGTSDLNIYCVYESVGTLVYCDYNGVELNRVEQTYQGAAEDIKDACYRYIIADYEVENGYLFTGWKDIVNRQFYKDDELSTQAKTVTLTATRKPILVSSLIVSPKESTITVGQSIVLTAHTLPENALNSSIQWESDDSAIASVTNDGIVTGHKVGIVKISAHTTDESDLSDYATITVIDPPIEQRKVTIRGILRYTDGTPIANKLIRLDRYESLSVMYGGNDITAMTDENGRYEFQDIYVGLYMMRIIDDGEVLVSCQIQVADPESDKVNVKEKDDGVAVEYEISNNTFQINVSVAKEQDQTPTPSPKTADDTQIDLIVLLLMVSLLGFLKKRK